MDMDGDGDGLVLSDAVREGEEDGDGAAEGEEEDEGDPEGEDDGVGDNEGVGWGEEVTWVAPQGRHHLCRVYVQPVKQFRPRAVGPSCVSPEGTTPVRELLEALNALRTHRRAGIHTHAGPRR
jgi:hypothetical protein